MSNRDALDAAMDDLETRASLYHNAGGPHRDHYRRDLTAARAAVRKAAREMGAVIGVAWLGLYTDALRREEEE